MFRPKRGINVVVKRSSVKIAVAGSGFGRKVALPVYREIEEFEPVGCWSRTPERAVKVANEFGLELGTSDFDELLAIPGLEAVHLATPVVTHLPLARAVVERGLHLLCEKPLADNLENARRIAGAVADAGVVGAVNYSLRMKSTRKRLIEVAQQVVGRPRMAMVALVHSDHSHPESRPFTWVHDAQMGGGRLQGYGVHDLDLLLEIFPRVDSVAAALEVGVGQRISGGGELLPVTAEDAYGILLRFEGGGLGVVSLVATARHERRDLVEIYGDQGTVKLDADYRLWWGRAGDELQVEGPLSNSSNEAFRRVARRFWLSIREGAPPDPSLEEALRVQAVYDAIKRADAERRWVSPEQVEA
ncbi:MAG TPA: Gfo/Idh/MocA family oxidoreductase [Actinomycetota bacterium]|nr:Gfo/Idh/MocA family oxidoreductase [Actinomycetota bacterium]